MRKISDFRRIDAREKVKKYVDEESGKTRKNSSNVREKSWNYISEILTVLTTSLPSGSAGVRGKKSVVKKSEKLENKVINQGGVR